ncbi:Scr1 family TA system antitoxin-like transcriptional regulator [Streptomyces sp. NPDC049910]|uniref:Scr1 family TA system antitoxin-like transcriptional regulator n=1 Tax=Streptomyces sp. NPDC049910 TaxID=3155278 RepID=UPI0034124457
MRGLPRDEEEEIREKAIERIRIERADPPFSRAVIDEAALSRPVSSNHVMHEQLRALLTFQQYPHVRIQIIATDAREHGMMGGSLDLLDLPGGTVALVESFRTGQAVESSRAVVEYEELFEAAQRAALPEEASTAIIRRYMERYENEDDHSSSVAEVLPQRVEQRSLP